MNSIEAQTYVSSDREDLMRTLSYWKEQLRDWPPVLDLPTDHPRIPRTSHSVKNFSFLLPKFLCEDLEQLGHQSETKVPLVLLATFKTLLYRYTNQEDILLAARINPLISINEMGKLEKGQPNTMFFRTKLSDDPGFLELVKRIRTTALEAGDYQSLPFESLVRSLQTEGIPVDSLFQVFFEFGYVTNSESEATTLTANDTLEIPDLGLSIVESNEGLVCNWKYNRDLFFDSTINRMTSHFQSLLLGIFKNPDQAISEFRFLSAAERLQILVEWNNTERRFPDDKCIHELFEEQVKRTPEAVAVEMYDGNGMNSLTSPKKLTYHQLNTRANQLAHYLRELGVGPDRLVGVCAARSPEMIVGILGVLKAGGAYVPLDPSYPLERLQFMLKDSAVSVLLTQEDLKDRHPADLGQVVYLDRDWEKIAKRSDKNPTGTANPNNLAYVIYTSGSTGIPKGTLIIHRGVVNYLTWCVKEYAVADGSGAPVNSSVAFDATVTSLFAPLLAGKRVLLLPEVEEIEALGSVLLSRNNFSLVKITPAHLQILRHLLPADQIENQTNAMVIGGEALQAKDVDLWHKYAPKTRLINEYGPTETVVGCCTYEIIDSLPDVDIPIGRPIANTQIYILDRHMEPVPIGVSGEIYIGGEGVAGGYLNRPELTAQRFVCNPFNTDPNSRLYKTGDLATYLCDGNIIFRGRIDHQVKVRGYRIELAEIESVLAKHPSVKHLVVVAREDNPGEKRLVAYLAVKNQIPVNDLKLFLREKLPEYMIPSAFVFLETLPLTANGKIDRAALPAPAHHSNESEKISTAPRNSIELKLTEIFQKCLNIPKVGVTDDFFELGGSSIQAAIIFSQIKKTLGKKLPLSTLIHSPTIEKLAFVILSDAQGIGSSSLVPIQPNGSRPPLFCIHGGWGNVLFYRHLSKRLGNDQPLYGLQPKGLSDNEEPYFKLEEMAAHYIRELRSVQPDGPYYIAGYCFGAIVAFEMAQQLVRAGEKIAFLGSFNGISPTYNDQGKHNPIQTLKELNSKEKFTYLKKIARSKIIVAKFRLQVMIRSLGYKFYFVQGRSLPEAVRRFYIVDAILVAQKDYKPDQYHGNLTIFRSPKIFRITHLGWRPLVRGEIKTVDIPGNHSNRTRIMYEPFVEFLAQEIKKHLEKATKTN